jgi:hypothetical protein
MTDKQTLQKQIDDLKKVLDSPKTQGATKNILQIGLKKAEAKMEELNKAIKLDNSSKELTIKQEKNIGETKKESSTLANSLKQKVAKAKQIIAKNTPKPTTKKGGARSIKKSKEKALERRSTQKNQSLNKSDIEKDAVRTAISKIKRTSNGGRANQYGTKAENKGGVYYEKRENRYDVQNKRYAKLEDGGTTGAGSFADGGVMNGGTMGAGYYADGGTLGAGSYAKGGKTPVKAKKRLEELEDYSMYSEIKNEYEENEDENRHSENVVLLAKHFGTESDLKEAKRIFELHEKEGSLSSENGKKRQMLHLKLIVKARKEMGKEGIMFADGGMMAKGGMVVTSIKDIPNFKQRLDEGKITYRGLGMGKLSDDFYDLAGEGGSRIKVDGKEYYITNSEFDTFNRGKDGLMRIRFAAPYRKGYEEGGGIDLLADTSGETLQNVGGTTFSNVNLTSHLDLTNPMFAKGGETHRGEGGMYAKGGMTEHGLRKGDEIIDDQFWENSIVVRNRKDGTQAVVSLSTGERKESQM